MQALSGVNRWDLGSDYASMSIEEVAVTTANWLLVKRVMRHRPGWLDEEDARQDVSLYVLERLGQYDPSKGAVTTFVTTLFDHWYRNYMRMHRWRTSTFESFDPNPDTSPEAQPLAVWVTHLPDDSEPAPHEVSELAQAWLDLIPERDRGLVLMHLGYGVSLSSVADIEGMERSTVHYRINRARRIWRECHEDAA